MYKRLSYIFLFFVLLQVACATNPEKITNQPEWQGRMQGFAQNMYYLYPLASDPGAFRDPENRSHIDDAMTSLALRAHEMSKAVASEELRTAIVDPEVKVLSATFKRDLMTAVDAYRKQDFEFSRISIHNALQLCIRCHTRMPDSQNRKAILDPQGLVTMKPMFRADFMTAARNFDGALSIYEGIIKDRSFAKNSPADWDSSVLKAMAIAVRVKNDPALSEKVADEVLSSNAAPHYLYLRVQQWKTEIHEWKKDTLRLKLHDDDLLRAEAMINYARDPKSPFFGNYRNAYIYLLRAAAYLHSYLGQTSDPTKSARGYLLLGQCYEALQTPGEVDLTKNYYKACILASPHSDIASNCFDRYEESTYSDSIGGSSSLSLGTVDYLEYLRGLATP